MSLKTELKMHVLHEQGVKADDLLENATKRMAAHDGAKQALRLIGKNISGLAALVDKDIEDGKLPTDEPAAVASYVKLMIDRAMHMALSAGQHQENLQLSVGGEIVAYQSLVASFKKDLLVEQAKLDAKQAPVEEGDRRPAGTHPSSSIAAQRRAEEVLVEVPPPVEIPEVVEAGSNGASSPVKTGKRGGRRKAS